MYNFKEKKLHFNALRNPDAAIYDLELLRKGCPWLPQLRTYARDPKRYADEILYSLLDHTTRENIRAFRRQKLDELKAVAEVPGTGSETPSANAITTTDNDTTATDETSGTGGETPPVSETTIDNGIPATNETTSTDTTNSPASEKIKSWSNPSKKPKKEPMKLNSVPKKRKKPKKKPNKLWKLRKKKSCR